MNILKNILCEMRILSEAVEVNDVNDAVKGMQKAKITYDDQDGGSGKGQRVICPVAYGISTNGNPVVRAFQISGDSKRGSGQWKLFKLSNINSWETINSEKYDPSRLVGFNKDGDKQMEIIYSIAPIGNAKDIKISKAQGTPIELTSGPVTKSYVEKSGTSNKERMEQQKQEMLKNAEKANDNRYTANNAVNDILKTAKNYSVEKEPDSIDNSNNSSYNTKKSQEVKPITKSEIPGGNNIVPGKDEQEANRQAISDDPVKKTDINGDKSSNNEKEEDIDDVKSNFANMMNRIDKAGNDETDEDKEEDK